MARNLPIIARSRHIAAYLPNDGEIDPLPLMGGLWSMGKTLYLPVLNPIAAHQLWFARYREGDELVTNRYGILEPRQRQLVNPRFLDLVLTPLVAFDTDCNRLGMGGGYYDTSFAFLRNRHCWIRPRLLGLAYELQKCPRLQVNDWDIPLHAVITEERTYCRT